MATYQPRLNSDGMSGSIYWYSNTNPYYPAYGLPNCTCYAWGRFWEINDQMGHAVVPIGMIGNANMWYNNSLAYQHGMTPKLGAIICFDGGSFATGHVGVVEQINYDSGGNVTSIVTSNSDYGGTYFYLMTLTPPYSSGTLSFQGFIYNPYTDQPEPTPTIEKKKGFKFNLWGNYVKSVRKF